MTHLLVSGSSLHSIAHDMGIKKKHVPGCGCCGDAQWCGCDEETICDEFQVTIAGIVDDNCSSCEEFNGTFSLSKSSVGIYECVWQYVFAASPCGGPQPSDITLSISRLVGGYRVYVTLLVCDYGPGGPYWSVTWRQDFSGSDCELTAQSITYLMTSTVGDNQCTGSSATCTVTAVCA